MCIPALALVSSSHLSSGELQSSVPSKHASIRQKIRTQMRLHHEAKIMGCAWVSQTHIDAFYVSSWSFLSDSDCVTFHQLGNKYQKTSVRFHMVYIINFIRKKTTGRKKGCIILIQRDYTEENFFYSALSKHRQNTINKRQICDSTRTKVSSYPFR